MEFKSYIDHPSEGGTVNSRDKKKLSKIFNSLVAFLNTDGGMLIWGSPLGATLPGERENSYSGTLIPVPSRLEQDEFYGKIASEISPIPTGITFCQIPLSNGAHCYLFEVVKSETPPHQFKGTYFIRVGASTHTAPHSIVEAMIKKISFPKLEGFLTFGDAIFTAGYAIIPSAIFIYNESNFIQEKRLQVRLNSHGCDFRSLSSTETEPFTYEHDFIIDAKDILHKSVPFQKELLLIIPREIIQDHITHIQIMMIFWGERSPAISCKYDVFVKVLDIRKYEVSIDVKKIENKYMYETRDNIKASGNMPSLEQTHNQIVENLESTVRGSFFYNNMKK